MPASATVCGQSCQQGCGLVIRGKLRDMAHVKRSLILTPWNIPRFSNFGKIRKIKKLFENYYISFWKSKIMHAFIFFFACLHLKFQKLEILFPLYTLFKKMIKRGLLCSLKYFDFYGCIWWPSIVPKCSICNKFPKKYFLKLFEKDLNIIWSCFKNLWLIILPKNRNNFSYIFF